MNIEVPLQNIETMNRQFEAVITDTKKETIFWKKVDDRHYSIVYSGDWTEEQGGEKEYLYGR